MTKTRFVLEFTVDSNKPLSREHVRNAKRYLLGQGQFGDRPHPFGAVIDAFYDSDEDETFNIDHVGLDADDKWTLKKKE